jgi:hypothetical protein
MKQILPLLLLASTIWTLESGAANAELLAGAAKTDITPAPGISLDGPISKNGPVVDVNDPLHARALVLSDGRTTLAIVICDVCMIEKDVCEEAKNSIAKYLAIPANRVLIAGTHTHAAPRLTHIGTSPADDAYHHLVATRMTEAVEQAKENLAPAVIGWGHFERPELIACRRFLCEPGSVAPNPFGKNGERIKSVSGQSTQVIGPAGPTDPEFFVLSVRHADGSPLALLGNFSVHYCGGYKRGRVSADYFGFFSQTIEDRLPAGKGHPPTVGLMSNGTSGNTGAIDRGGKKYEPYEWLELSGRMLAEDAIEVAEKIEYRGDLSLEMSETELTFDVRKPDASRLEWADKILASQPAEYPHRWSKVYAQEARHLAKSPDRVTHKFQTIRIGDLAIATAPCEVFAETGLEIKQNSPFDATFIIELANGYGGYLPTAQQHEWGGYETWPARSSHLEISAASRIRKRLGEMLNALKRND